jgi:hypothetical protein
MGTAQLAVLCHELLGHLFCGRCCCSACTDSAEQAEVGLHGFHIGHRPGKPRQQVDAAGGSRQLGQGAQQHRQMRMACAEWWAMALTLSGVSATAQLRSRATFQP